MAQKRGKIDTSYLSRIIYKIHETDAQTGDTVFTGTYKLMLRAQSLPSPTSPPNPVEITDFEDDSQTYTMGIKSSDAKEITGNLDKVYFDQLLTDEGKQVDILQLYGRDGVGGLAKSAYVGQFTPTVNDVGGVDEVIQMTCTVVQNTSPIWVTDDLVVTDNGDGTFTVTQGAVTPDIVLNKSNLALTVGNTAKLKATTIPADATVTWTSGSTSIATVVDGTVTAVGVGSTTVTAKITVDGSDYTDTCAVAVSAGV